MAGRGGGIMKPSTTDKGGSLKYLTVYGGSDKCYDVATKILRTLPQAINNDRSIKKKMLSTSASTFITQTESHETKCYGGIAERMNFSCLCLLN